MRLVALEPATSVVAVSEPTVPGDAGAPPSVSSEVTRPAAVPIEVLRTVCPAGAVQAVVADDLSAQYETTQLPGVVTVAAGVVCVAVAVVSSLCANAATGLVADVPDQAAPVRLVFTVPPSVTLTGAEASAAVATFVHRIVWIPVVLAVSSRVQPAGSLTVTVSALTVAVSTSPSPARTAAGTATVAEVALHPQQPPARL